MDRDEARAEANARIAREVGRVFHMGVKRGLIIAATNKESNGPRRERGDEELIDEVLAAFEESLHLGDLADSSNWAILQGDDEVTVTFGTNSSTINVAPGANADRVLQTWKEVIERTMSASRREDLSDGRIDVDAVCAEWERLGGECSTDHLGGGMVLRAIRGQVVACVKTTHADFFANPSTKTTRITAGFMEALPGIANAWGVTPRGERS